MAVQHRGVDGASVVLLLVVAAAVVDNDDGKEHIPKGILSRLKSDSAGM